MLCVTGSESEDSDSASEGDTEEEPSTATEEETPEVRIIYCRLRNERKLFLLKKKLASSNIFSQKKSKKPNARSKPAPVKRARSTTNAVSTQGNHCKTATYVYSNCFHLHKCYILYT